MSHRETVAGSVIQATGVVELEDGLLMGSHLVYKGSALYLGFNQGQCTHPCSSGGRLNSNLPGFAWLLGVEPGAGFDSQKLQC